MQLKLKLFSKFYFLFINRKFFELAGPKQKLNCQKRTFTCTPVISNDSHAQISFLNYY